MADIFVIPGTAALKTLLITDEWLELWLETLSDIICSNMTAVERCVCLQVTVIGLETVCLKSEIHPPAKKARLDKFVMASHLTTAGVTEV